jgi:GT2 family glycosyltransferase
MQNTDDSKATLAASNFIEVVFSIIIVSYKDEGIVIDCINSINAYNDIGAGLEIILVDNSPEHNVYNAVLNKFTEVKCVKNINNGFGAGNNLGASHAAGKYLLFLNPDTILVEPVLSFAITKFKQDDQLAMFGVKMVSKNLLRNASFYLIESGGLLRSIVAKLCNRWDLYLNGYMYIGGADMFVRKEDFIKCGKFDEKIFMYYEEPDLTIRLLSLGKRTAYFKRKKIIHLEGGTTKNSDVALRRRLDSAIYFNLKYSKNPRDMFLRELRLLYLKSAAYRLFGFGDGQKLKNNMDILTEYINRSKTT